MTAEKHKLVCPFLPSMWFVAIMTCNSVHANFTLVVNFLKSHIVPPTKNVSLYMLDVLLWPVDPDEDAD